MLKKMHKRRVVETGLGVRIATRFIFGFLIAAGLGLLYIAKTHEVNFLIATTEMERQQEITTTFPVGVIPHAETILEDPRLQEYLQTHLSQEIQNTSRISWFERVTRKIAQSPRFQNFASPVSRVLVILPGERREEVVDHFGDILDWDSTERETFLNLITASQPELYDGKFFPGHYVLHKNATPGEAASLILERFNTEIADRYTQEVAALVPLHDTLTIASMLEREAYDFTDMREIAGVIWNRLFAGMNLQIDATLQYARGSLSYEPKWWPQVHPRDKYIDSPFNTYQNDGLPPEPIGNPSVASVIAALNPVETPCMFYFHDEDANFHCTETYEEHVELLKQYYGRGK